MIKLHALVLLSLLWFAAYESRSQVPFLRGFALDSPSGTPLVSLPSNSISHISVQNNVLWIGTSKGLARSTDGGASWESFLSVPQFASRGIFSIDIKGDTVWASTGFTKDVNGQGIQTGTGFAYSTDNGISWTNRLQPLDALNDSLVAYGNNIVRFLPIVVPEQNVTFDSDITDSVVWITSWSSGLRKSTNLGQTWQRIVLPSQIRNTIAPSDDLTGYVVDPRRDNNFLAFSVFAQSDSIIWCGTAGGINKSTDQGVSWTKFTTLNQVEHIAGNWVIAIKGQPLRDSYRLWCTNWKADIDPNERFAVSYTEDAGRTWRSLLQDIKAYDFAFKDSIAYVATADGLYRTGDGGESWDRSGTIIDTTSGVQLEFSAFYCVGVIGDTVYAGTDGGLVKTIDNAQHPFGSSWTVIRTYRQLVSQNSTYAYPNPFSPAQEVIRMHYSTGGIPASVTVEIFDFGMNRVRTVVKDAQRYGAQDHDEVWDGRDDSRNQVSNGVYFYRVVMNGGNPVWGKILVLQ